MHVLWCSSGMLKNAWRLPPDKTAAQSDIGKETFSVVKQEISHVPSFLHLRKIILCNVSWCGCVHGTIGYSEKQNWSHSDCGIRKWKLKILFRLPHTSNPKWNGKFSLLTVSTSTDSRYLSENPLRKTFSLKKKIIDPECLLPYPCGIIEGSASPTIWVTEGTWKEHCSGVVQK